jgi:hypothetical protein
MPFHCPEVSVVCPASRPYPGALGFRPALVPNRACMTARSLRQRPGTLSSVPLVRRVPMPTAVGVRAAIETSERGPARVWSPPPAGREIMCACACVRPVLQNAKCRWCMASGNSIYYKCSLTFEPSREGACDPGTDGRTRET